MPDITYDVGRVSFVMKGAWNLATSYEKLDAVSYGGSLYIAKQDVPGGTAITNTTYWQLAAEKGDKGDTGGVDSVNGQQGDVWFPDSRQLISDGYTTDTDPFLMKGNSSDSDRFELAKKHGNTVCVNQQVQNPHFESLTIWTNLASVSGGIGTSISLSRYAGIRQDMSPVVGHTYLLEAVATADSNRDLRLCFFNGATALDGFTITVASGTFTRAAQIVTLSDVANRISLANWSAGAAVIQAKEILCIDLTLWFGGDNRIPSDLLNHPENWGDYYSGSLAYNAGTLESADGTKLTSFGTDGVTVLTEVDTGGEVLRSAGKYCDEKDPDGTITRMITSGDLGDLSWAYDNSYGFFYANISSLGIIKILTTDDTTSHPIICAAYATTTLQTNATDNNWTSEPNKTIGYHCAGSPGALIYLYIKDTSYGSDAAAFKTGVTGVRWDFVLATPTTEQGTAFEPLVVTVKNGVLSWTNTKGIPVGHESHWFENLRKRVEDRLPDPPSADGTYRLTCTISGGVKTYSWEA